MMTMLPNWGRAIIARGAAVLASAILVFVADKLGAPVTEDHHAALTEALTLLGGVMLMLGYGALRPLISRFIHPQDDNQPIHTGARDG